ncbi:MAG: single-stranded DNA-binding protein, partial [Pyrinomonadaceae bacterium]
MRLSLFSLQIILGERNKMSFNKVIIVGNVGKEAVVRYTEQGTPVCEFTVATNERRKDAIGETEAITT